MDSNPLHIKQSIKYLHQLQVIKLLHLIIRKQIALNFHHMLY